MCVIGVVCFLTNWSSQSDEDDSEYEHVPDFAIPVGRIHSHPETNDIHFSPNDINTAKEHPNIE